jgi:DNA-binding IclR family transcriptional regulator
MAHHRTIDRVAHMLEFIASRPEGVTLSEVASVIAAPTSSAHSLLDGLVSVGYVDRAGSRYLLGPAPYVLTLQAQQSPAQMVTHHDLVRLADEGEFTVILGVRVGDDVVFIDEAGDDPMLQHIARTRMRRPTLEGVVGWVLIAALEDREMHEYLRRHERPDLVDDFLGALAGIRASGVAVGVAKGFTPRVGPGTETGVVATAVRDRSGRAIASVAIGQHPAYVTDHLDEIRDILLSHCRHWSTRQSTTESIDEAVPAFVGSASQ